MNGNDIVKQWVHNGLTCFVRREQFKYTILDGTYEAPCGYVAVPETHPLYGEPCTSNKCSNVHGYGDGLTFGGFVNVNGVDRWCFGFNMAYWFFDFDESMTCVRTDEECVKCTNAMADALVKEGIRCDVNGSYVTDLLCYVNSLEAN